MQKSRSDLSISTAVQLYTTAIIIIEGVWCYDMYIAISHRPYRNRAMVKYSSNIPSDCSCRAGLLRSRWRCRHHCCCCCCCWLLFLLPLLISQHAVAWDVPPKSGFPLTSVQFSQMIRGCNYSFGVLCYIIWMSKSDSLWLPEIDFLLFFVNRNFKL